MCVGYKPVLFTSVVTLMITFRILRVSNVVVLPGDRFLPCLQTITGSFFSAKNGRLKWILPVCVVLPIIRMQFSGLALAWLHKAASTLNSAPATVWNTGINCPIEYLQVSATTLVSQFAIYIISIDYRLIFPYTCLFAFWKHNNYGWLIHVCRFKRKNV